MALKLAEHATIYFSSVVMREMLDFFLLCHEVMVDPKMNQHLEVLFL